jgi:hypothetical protein
MEATTGGFPKSMPTLGRTQSEKVSSRRRGADASQIIAIITIAGFRLPAK